MRLPYTTSEGLQPIIVVLSFNAYSDYDVKPLPGQDTYRITSTKYPLDNPGKENKVTSI